MVGRSHPQPRKKDLLQHYHRMVTALVQQGQQIGSSQDLARLAQAHQTCSPAKRATVDGTLQLLIQPTAAALAAAHQQTAGGYVQIGTHRVPVRWSAAPRPPGAIRVLVDHAPPALARKGLTASLLLLSGYKEDSFQVLEEHLGHSSVTGDAALLAPCADTVVAWVVPPADDPLLVHLPDSFEVHNCSEKVANIYVEGRTARQPWLWPGEQAATLSSMAKAASIQQELRLYLAGPQQQQPQQQQPLQPGAEGPEADMPDVGAAEAGNQVDADMQDAPEPAEASVLPGDPFQQQPQPQQRQQREAQQQQQPQGSQQQPQPQQRQLRSSPSAFQQWSSNSGLAQSLMMLVEQVLEEGEASRPPAGPDQLRRSFWAAHRQKIMAEGDPSDAEAKAWLRQHLEVQQAAYDSDSDSDLEQAAAEAADAAPAAAAAALLAQLPPARSPRVRRDPTAPAPAEIHVLRRSTRSRHPPADVTLCSPAAFGRMSQQSTTGQGGSQTSRSPSTPAPVRECKPARQRPSGRGRG